MPDEQSPQKDYAALLKSGEGCVYWKVDINDHPVMLLERRHNDSLEGAPP